MRDTTYRGEASSPILGSMVWLAIGSFAIGFGGYLVFGLSLL